MSAQVILGVDIGTTSVKVCLIDATTREELATESKDTQSNVTTSAGLHGIHEQNVRKIVSTLHNCILRMPKELLRHVKHIGICGQMHGIVLWRPPAWTDRFELVNEHISNLVTWQDTRCDPAFLASLPRPDSHLKAYTGYGINTLLWMTKHEPAMLETYSHAATIQDFIVAMLCDLDRPVMCNQNAASWGYFNCKLDEWNVDLLTRHEPQFSLRLLPKIQPSGTTVGTLTRDWLGIPHGTPINVALGDLQCSVLATLQYPTDAIVNISTSAQIAFIDDSFHPEEHYAPRVKTENGSHAAALGGNHELMNTVKSLGDVDQRTSDPGNEDNASILRKDNAPILGKNSASERAVTNVEMSGEANCDIAVDKRSNSLSFFKRLSSGPLRAMFNTSTNDVGYDEVDPISPGDCRENQDGNNCRENQNNCKAEQTVHEEQVESQCQSKSLCDRLDAGGVSHIEHFPYFNNKYIAVGASINGGNCLATFICTLQAWFKEFGFNVPQNQIWVKLIAQSDSINHIARYESDLTIVPTLLGDRHVSERASVRNIEPGNLNVNNIFVSLCKGIICNLHAIMNRSVLHASGITRIIGVGSCLSRNHILQHYVENVYELKLELENQSRDASYGAALSTIL